MYTHISLSMLKSKEIYRGSEPPKGLELLSHGKEKNIYNTGQGKSLVHSFMLVGDSLHMQENMCITAYLWSQNFSEKALAAEIRPPKDSPPKET